MLELSKSEYASFFQPYIDILDGNSKGIIYNLEDSLNTALLILEDISKAKQLYKYEVDKWTIKELVQHIIDSERVFGYRALTFSRNDTTPLPGFDENQFVQYSNANDRSYGELLEELKVVRLSTILLFKSFDIADFEKVGVASGKSMSLKALGYIISGHLLHHLKIIEERYLI
ncbi:DinB family protein [Aureibaculum sp. A20]|uniref:DinB family protein n=1 Tax=Aureibaculum flavum TaxID=2795986 RepID=A0ABS0WMI3_9FLAO|nr:DinB family protein [Aureibaculum flavum]MBJ2173180.1 DinB family protein [Aureibaculum flavum]